MVSNQKFEFDVSIVIPVYNNENSLLLLVEELYRNVIQNNHNKKFEIIFIDDGSKDGSFDVLLKLRHTYPTLIKILKFSRNFGQGPAVTAGFNNARGELITTVDADLQDPPNIINDFIKSYYTEHYEISVATRQNRKESYYRRIGSFFWYKFIKKITFPEFPEKGFNSFGLSSKVRDLLMENVYNGTPFTNVLIVWTGYPIKYIPYTRQNRQFGVSQFGFLKKIKAMLDVIIAFSFSPIRLMIKTGILLSLLGFLYAASIIIAKYFGGTIPFRGWAPIMVTILIIGGFQMIMIGLIGEYLWRTLDIARKRSIYVIEKII